MKDGKKTKFDRVPISRFHEKHLASGVTDGFSAYGDRKTRAFASFKMFRWS
jgi:hypothetical protein